MAETTLVADRTGELRMTPAAKQARYREVVASIQAIIAPERDLLACMASVVCLLHNAFPYFFWTGFYRRVGATRLLVGPYQGTMGCLEIEFGRGVCGTVASERLTRVVDDVNAFPGHIACDSASASEIVLPVFDAAGELIGVFDVDSTLHAAFDDVDREWLERILGWLAPKQNLPFIAAAG
jgi:L-methionine (R)-S-oxide reductase